jgi:CheY-like chemotaxis protein
MPVLDGRAFLRQRLRQPALTAIPVVVLSATGREEKAEARALGADAFLLKPVEPEVLLDAIRRYCRRPTAAQPGGLTLAGREGFTLLHSLQRPAA